MPDREKLSKIYQHLAYYNTFAARHRFILIVGHCKTGKSELIGAAAEHCKAPVLNLNLALSSELIVLPRAKRPLMVDGILQKIFAAFHCGEVFCMDNLELLFDSELKIDPLRVITQWSRSKIIIASWLGTYDGDRLTYGEPSHPDYRSYLLADGAAIDLNK